MLEKTEKTEGMVEGGSLEIRNSSRRCLQGERSLRRSCLRQVAAGAAQGRGSSGGEGGDGGGKVLPRSAVKRQLNVVAILKRRNLGVLGGGRGGKLRV